MCLAIPGKVISTDDSAKPRMGTVVFGGIQKRVCLEWIPDVRTGEYVIVHVGFAISRVDEGEALRALKLIEEMQGGLDELRTGEPDGESIPPSP